MKLETSIELSPPYATGYPNSEIGIASDSTSNLNYVDSTTILMRCNFLFY